MINRVDFQAQSFLQPLLQVWILRIDLTGHDAHRRAAVDAFQAIENRPQEGFPFLVPAHVVNGENDDRLDSFFADPLRRHQLGKGARNVIGIQFIQIGQSVSIRGLQRGRKQQQ